jgi:hypothetical protein
VSAAAPAASLPFAVTAPVVPEWDALGGSTGVLGLPTSPQITGQLRGGGFQNFQGGAISWSPATGVHATYGDIRQEWRQNGFEFGVLGYPTSEVTDLSTGGRYQNYEGGAVVSSSAGAFLSVAPIRTAWGQNGYENGPLGYPTSGIVGIRDGGTFQNYQGGAVIVWRGIGFASLGSSREVWLALGYENGVLGYPTSAFVGIRDGGTFQNYEGGAIVSSSAGAFASYGALRMIWGARGYENGVLGYPTSKPSYSDPSNGEQAFEGGTIRVINGSSSILYKAGNEPAWYATTHGVSATELFASYRIGCPVTPSQLVRLTFPYWDLNGGIGEGNVVVASNQAAPIARALAQAYESVFPLGKAVPVEVYGGSDPASMQDNNTSAFNCRTVTGNPRQISQHSYGNAIDVNPAENPYVIGSSVYPTGSTGYLNRAVVRPGMIEPGDAIAGTMANLGWYWGARWADPDYQHFSSNGG